MSDLPRTFVPGFHNEDAVKRMKYNKFGQTGLNISRISIGAAGLSQFYGEFSEEEAITTIQEAIKSGINYIDTAPWYGQGRSEEILGKALKDVPREAYYIGTKVGRYDLIPENMFDFSSQKTFSSVDASLKRLGLDYVDIIQVHDVEFASSIDIIVRETLPTLKTIVQNGQAHYIGVTGYPVSVLKQVVEESQTHITSILSYSRMTLIDDTLATFIPYFQKQGIGIINAASTAMGLLTNAGPQSWHPANDELKYVCQKAAKYCQEHNVELGRLAMYHSLIRNGPVTHLVGMNTLKILKSNIDLLINGLTDNEKQVLQEVNEKFLSKWTNSHWEGMEKYT